jgi:hypothetical protein
MASELNASISPPMDSTQFKSFSSAKVTRCSIQPENRTELVMTAGNMSDIYFAIPSRPNCFINPMNTYLSFTYNLTGTSAVAGNVSLANGTGSNFFRSMEILAGSTSCEIIQNYNVIASLVDDFQPQDRGRTIGSILSDKVETQGVIKSGVARVTNPAVANGPLPATATTERRICAPLLSCMLGTLSEKYIPVGKDCGLRLRLTAEDPNVCLVCVGDAADSFAAAALGYRLSDITLEIEYIELPPQMYSALANEAGNVFKICGTSIGSFAVTVPAGGQAQSIMIPARYSSVRNIFTTVRRQDALTNRHVNSVGARVRDFISSYVYRVSGVNYPNLPVSSDGFTGAEVFSELSKCWSAHSSLDLNTVFGATAFNLNGTEAIVNVAANRPDWQTRGSFLMGCAFEESGFSSAQMSGINTTSGNTFLDVTYLGLPAGGCQATIFDSFVFYDNIIEINHLTGEVTVSR